MICENCVVMHVSGSWGVMMAFAHAFFSNGMMSSVNGLSIV